MSQKQINRSNAVKNIALESEKSNYNPKIDMNWCNLPMEMRLECVKWMDLKTRCRFRRTSQVEKLLVEAKNNQLENVLIAHDQFFEWMVIVEEKSGNWSDTVRLLNGQSSDSDCLAAILKHAEVKNFGLMTKPWLFGGAIPPLLEHMAKFAPFGFRRISINNIESTAFLLKNCPNLEKVDYYGGLYRFPFSKILEAPSLMNVKEFKLAKVFSSDFLEFFEKLVQKWIDNDVGIGNSMQFEMQNFSLVAITISEFAEKFPDRVIEKTDKEVRIRMNNNTTQILLRQVGIKHEEFPRIHLVAEYCSCKIVPIDMPESEYANGDGWIQAVYEKELKKDGVLEKTAEFEDEDQEIWRYRYH